MVQLAISGVSKQYTRNIWGLVNLTLDVRPGVLGRCCVLRDSSRAEGCNGACPDSCIDHGLIDNGQHPADYSRNAMLLACLSFACVLYHGFVRCLAGFCSQTCSYVWTLNLQ